MPGTGHVRNRLKSSKGTRRAGTRGSSDRATLDRARTLSPLMRTVFVVVCNKAL
jgi:hypothetical protein